MEPMDLIKLEDQILREVAVVHVVKSQTYTRPISSNENTWGQALHRSWALVECWGCLLDHWALFTVNVVNKSPLALGHLGLRDIREVFTYDLNFFTTISGANLWLNIFNHGLDVVAVSMIGVNPVDAIETDPNRQWLVNIGTWRCRAHNPHS